MYSKSRVKRIISVAIIIILALFAMVIVSIFIKNQNESPIDVVRKIDGTSAFSFQSELKQIDLDDNNVMVFYYNKNYNIACVLMQKKFYGYKILNMSGELRPQNDKKTESRMYSFFKDKSKAVCWGILYNHQIVKVVIENTNADIVNAGNIKLWYHIGDYNIDINDIEFYNKNNQVVERNNG